MSARQKLHEIVVITQQLFYCNKHEENSCFHDFFLALPSRQEL